MSLKLKRTVVFFISIFTVIASLSVGASAHSICDDVNKNFVVSKYNIVHTYVTKPTKVSDVECKDIVFYDADGNELSSDSYITTNCSYSYYGDFAEITKCILLGDVDCSGKVNIKDARLAMRIAIRLEKCDEVAMLSADIDFNDTITVSDAKAILRYSAGIDNFDSFKAAVAEKDRALDDNYADPRVTVILKSEYNGKDKVLVPEFYGSELVKSVTLSETDGVCMYYLELNEPSADNIKALRDTLAANDAVLYVK